MKEPLRLAVADDEPDMRDYYRRILPRLGHQVVAACATGAELGDRCRELCPDLVITDVKMPEMDGFEAVARNFQHEPVPVILVSAHPDPELLRRITRDVPEMDAFMGLLVKPIKQADLSPAIALPVDSEPVRMSC